MDWLAVMSAWRESQCFTDLERATLELAESLMLIGRPEQVRPSGLDGSEVLTAAA